jgi:hypothetical protein
MSRHKELTESPTPEWRQALGVMAVFAAGAFALSTGLRGAWDWPLWNALGPLLTAVSCIAVIKATVREKWWIAIAALYLQVLRLRGDASLPLGMTFGLDISWCGALYAAFQGRQALATGAVVVCAGVMMVAALLTP